MNMDTFLTQLYVFIDDWYKAEIEQQIKRVHGPSGQLSDSEVLTLAIVGQWRWGVPWQSERGMVRYMQGEGRQWFPLMLSKSRYNERVRWLWSVLIKLQQTLAEALGSRASLYEVVDCTPLPSCSYAQSLKKRHWLFWGRHGYGGTNGRSYWGDQLLMSVTREYAITGWVLAPANVDDRMVLQGFISQRAGHPSLATPKPWRPHRQIAAPAFIRPLWAVGQAAAGNLYLADKGFNGIRWQNHWFQHWGVSVVTEPAENLKPAHWSTRWSRTLHRMRQVIESAFAVFKTVFALQRISAHSLSGQVTRVAAATAAFNWGLWLNHQTGRQPLSHATLFT